MSAIQIIWLMIAYFGVLLVISWFTSRNSTNETFYNADHKSPWYLVAFGLIGTSLSGVSLISVTGKVSVNHFGYMQIVLGYVAGYIIISYVLLPLYYKHNLTSIYNYLSIRFGNHSRKTGSYFFIVSRLMGAAARLYLVVVVMQQLVFSKLDYVVSFEATVAIILLLIFLYTFQSGIKTIIWTDTLQTILLLFAIFFSIVELNNLLGNGIAENFQLLVNNQYTQIFTKGGVGFAKEFFGGMFICLTMTGLDQGMMQRSLSCPSLKDAQKNILSFAAVVLVVNLLFMYIGGLMSQYSITNDLIYQTSDDMFPYLASNVFGAVAASLFILGMVAATFSSADDAMAALTTSFCLDILDLKGESKKSNILRKIVHLGVAVVLFLLIVLFFKGQQKAVIDLVLNIGSITYGPLLGMFAFGMFTKKEVNDKWVPYIAIGSPLLIMSFCIYIFTLQFPGTVIMSDFYSLTKIWYMVFKVVGIEIIIYIASTVFLLMLLSSQFNTKVRVLSNH